MRLRLSLLAALGGMLVNPWMAGAQDVAIVNARVVVGNGTVIDRGTIVVRGGQIQSVTAAAGNASVAETGAACLRRLMPRA